MATEMRKGLNNKLMVLGIDALDPRFTKRCIAKGLMPNTAELIRRGACREDLVLLGGHPTVTPPMWATLSTGCYANVHGITGFYRKSDTATLDTIMYNLDSRLCKAEHVWNCTAESGLKTLVWHWPGCSWPPTSDSENLYVVDGTSPGSVGMAISQVDTEFLVGANVGFKGTTFRAKAASAGVAPCVITDLDLEDGANTAGLDGVTGSKNGLKMLITKEEEQGHMITELALDMVQSEIKEPTGWADIPKGAKEFTMLFSGGLISRPCLVLQNEETGEYDSVAIYKNKKVAEPIVVVSKDEMALEVVDEAIYNDVRYRANRNMRILTLEPDGSMLSMWISAGMDMDNDSVYHPQRLHKAIVENCGYPTPTSMIGHQDKTLITDCMLANWYATADWQARALHHMIDNEGVEVIFSHMHSVDLQMHLFIKHLTEGKEYNRLPHEDYVKFAEDVYIQADYYLGKFLHYLDEGWTIIVTSDHGQVASYHDMPWWGEISGINMVDMEKLGYTVVKRDENGNKLMKEIDWEKTRAVAQREGHIYINLKGRETTGIVDPADKYELEEQIITDMYGLKDPKTGKRVIAVALHNKDAVLLGQGGPDAGDICYWNAEGYNYDHGDSLSTFYGSEETSASPIFIGTGKGFKEGYYTDRMIRQIDVAPTVAAILGVRMPAQCEGAPAYQILDAEF